MIRIRKILYPTDFSSYSNQAYFHAVALAKNHGAALTILFVYSPDLPKPSSVAASAARAYWQEQLRADSSRSTRPSRSNTFSWKAIPPGRSSAMAGTRGWT